MQNQLIQTFCTLVRIDSPTGSEWEFSNYLKIRIRELNIPVIQDRRGNLFISFRGTGEPLLFVAHLDTVEPGRGILPVLKNKTIRSKKETILGADNKAAVAILFELVRWAITKRSHRAFEVLLTVSEESGTSGVDTFNFTRVRSREALCFDVAKPFGTIVTSSPYYLRQNIRIRGKEADASTAERGRSVIPALVEFLKVTPQGVRGDTFCNIGVIQGGNVANALLSDVQLQGEIRSFTKKNLEKHSFLTKSLVQKTTLKYGCVAYYSQKIENHGYRFNVRDQLVGDITTIMQKIVHRPIQYINYWGVSDANNLNKRGIKTLNLGYGAKNPHTAKESISIDEMRGVFRFLQTILANNTA